MIKDILAAHSLFSSLSPEHLEVLVEAAEERQYADGDVIFRLDDQAAHFYLIQSGTAVVQIPSIYGPPLVMQTLSSGQLLGWSWLIPPYKWHFEARATSDMKVIAFDGQRLRHRCEQDPALGYQLLKLFSALMSERVQAARLKMMEVCEPAEIE